MASFVQRDQIIGIFVLLSLSLLFPLALRAAETPTMVIEEAKLAIDQARKAGAEKFAPEDLQAAKRWLSQAEKEYEERKSIMGRAWKMVGQDKAKEQEIIYLGTMARTKAQMAETKSKRQGVSSELKDSRKDLADYQSALVVIKSKVAEAQKAREVQAKAEEERKQLGEAKRKTAEMEELKKKEFAEARRKAEELEAQKKRELEEAQQRTAQMEAQKQKELQEARLQETQRAMEREKEIATAKLQAERLAVQRLKEEMEIKAKEEKFKAEKEKMAVLQSKTQALEREKTMLAEASKISQVTAKTGNQAVVLTILAINLFTPANELKPEGKGILDQVGRFLEKYPGNKVVIRGHTDSTGKPAANQTVSDKRAQKVREYLIVYQNLLASRVAAEGLGPSQPVAANTTEAGRALNRRVEIAVLTGD